MMAHSNNNNDWDEDDVLGKTSAAVEPVDFDNMECLPFVEDLNE